MSPSVLLFTELIMEILSWLPVKSLLRFMCVSKQFLLFISDPSFVQLHLQRSPRGVKSLIELDYPKDSSLDYPKDSSLYYPKDSSSCQFLLSFPIHSLIESPSSLIASNLSPRFPMMKNMSIESCVLGSCNGLVCLTTCEFIDKDVVYTHHLWNPATGKISKDPQCVLDLHRNRNGASGFGYDNLSDTYKVISVDIYSDSLESDPFDVRVCNISDNNCWRKIQNFPAEPIKLNGCGTYLNSTVNWIAHESVHELVIVSLDLRNETYTKLLVPGGLDGVLAGDFISPRGVFTPHKPLEMSILKGSLSLFFHNSRTNRFSLWQMKEFGNQKSWTLLYNFATQDLQIDDMSRYLKPICMLENGSVLITYRTSKRDTRAVLYCGRDNIVKHSEIFSNIWGTHGYDYVESLVLPGRY